MLPDDGHRFTDRISRRRVSRLTLQTRFQLGVHRQNMLLNPGTQFLMQATKQLRMKAFRPAAFLELLKKLPELFVRLFVLRMSRTAVSLHASLLKPEMRFAIGLEEINQVEQELGLLPRRIGIGQHALQMIGIVNQHPVLLIDRGGTDNELFAPEYHDKIPFDWPSKAVTGPLDATVCRRQYCS
jgi:hypothetical protein